MTCDVTCVFCIHGRSRLDRSGFQWISVDFEWIECGFVVDYVWIYGGIRGFQWIAVVCCGFVCVCVIVWIWLITKTILYVVVAAILQLLNACVCCCSHTDASSLI